MSIYKVTFGITNVIYVMADSFADAEKKTMKIINKDYANPTQIYKIKYLGEVSK